MEASSLKPIQSTKQYCSHRRQHRRISPVIPLSLPIPPTDRAINKRNSTRHDQNPTQRVAFPKVRCDTDSQSHEDVPRAVHHHQAIDELLVCSGSWRLELEEGEGGDGTQNGVDAEADENCAEYVGGDGK